MAITLNGTTGITTPGVTNSGAETIATTLAVTGAATVGGALTVTGAVRASAVATDIYPLVTATAVASTSGTSIDFTGIPSWVSRITVMLTGVSTNGTSNLLIRIGDSGGIETTGYSSVASAGTDAGAYQSSTAGYIIDYGTRSATSVTSGAITLMNLSGNIWVESGNVGDPVTQLVTSACSGTKTLSATLTQLRITTVGGTDTFDAGSINILYE